MRQDPERESDLTHAAEAGLPPAEAMTDAGVNDTSVIRGPAIKKAGRLDSYGAVRKLPSDVLPSSGVRGQIR